MTSIPITAVLCSLASAPSPISTPGIFDVLRFGARGDGTTDDTAAFQAAADAAVAAGGGEIRLPGARTYVLRASKPTISRPHRVLIKGRNIHVLGQGMPTVRMEGIDKAWLESLDDLNSSGRDVFTAFSFVLASDCSVENVRFEGPWDGTGRLRYRSPRAKAVGFIGCTRCEVRGIRGVGVLGNLVNATPADPTVDGEYRPSTGIRVVDSIAERCLEDGFNFMGNTADAQLIGSTARACGSAGFEAASADLVVSNNVFEGNLGAGMSLSGRRVVATGNLSLRNGREGESGTGAGILITASPSVTVTDVILSANIVSSNRGPAIQIYPGVTRVTISGNHFTDNCLSGEIPGIINAVGSAERRIAGIRISGNDVLDERGSARFFVNANFTDGLVVKDNSVVLGATAAAAVVVQGQSRGSVVEGNRTNKPVSLSEER